MAEVKGNRVRLNPGDGIAVPDFEPHAYEFPDDTNCGETLIMHILCETPGGTNPFRELISPVFSLRFPQAEFRELLRIVAIRNLSNNLAFSCAEQYVKRFFLEQLENGNFSAAPFELPDTRIQRALEFMRLNLSNSISIRDVAEVAGLGEVRFRQLFQQNCGLSPNGKLSQMRLLQARRLLARSREPLERIAEQCGFRSASYFCLVFKKFFHCTPEHYRRHTQELGFK